MFQNNALLAKLKQQLNARIPREEGVVKATERGFGFLEVNPQKSYFIPPLQMKKVMHGDRITAIIRSEKERESADPEALIEPFLTRFVGKIFKKDTNLFILPDHPLIKEIISCRSAQNLKHSFKNGDWAIAEMLSHPLRNNRGFYAELTQFITCEDDQFLPWFVTLARYNLEKDEPSSVETEMLDEGLKRRDLTALDFITIDSASTEDIDDALYAEKGNDGKLNLIVAIADPTAWISEGSKLDNIAKVRLFTNYLPGFNIPMLPRKFSDNLCSLRENEERPVLACHMILEKNGAINKDVKFFAAIIKSKARLIYDQVSDWLENIGNWKPKSNIISEQIHLLYQIYLSRDKWRRNYALVFKDRPDYRFVLNKHGEVLDIVIEPRRVANRIIEEAMIAANSCAAKMLKDKLGFGIYNVHSGFNLTANGEALEMLLKTYNIKVNWEEILTLSGFCKLRRELDSIASNYLDSRIRRFQSFSEISTEPKPHFGLGLEVYATWTSPIRKYGDMINHRLLKAIIKNENIARPMEETTIQITERRRLNRIAERDVGDWLYARFLSKKVGTNMQFSAEIIDINRGGMRVRLINNGATAFIPAVFLHSVRDEIVFNQESGILQIKGEIAYKITDVIDVTIDEVRVETRNIIARPAFNHTI